MAGQFICTAQRGEMPMRAVSDGVVYVRHAMTDRTSVREVDPWRFLEPSAAKTTAARIAKQPPHPPIPWTAVSKPLSESKVALLTTAGISMKGAPPFDLDSERRHPTWGDPSFRGICSEATAADVEVSHLHINTIFIRRDLNVALPLDRLRELVRDGIVGSSAPTHYSTMGYQGSSTKILETETAPAIAASMARESVDVALLAPV
jgi:D-proline reductase (dithiol) PrdB